MLVNVQDHEEALKAVSPLLETELERIKPTSLTLDPLHICNFRCKYCVEGAARCHSRYTSLSTSTALTLISQFIDQGGSEIRIYGGEPTLFPEFASIVKHAAQSADSVRVVTNGSLLEKSAIAEALKGAAEVSELSVRVSLNSGTPRTHEELHGVKGFFPKVLRGIENLSNSSVQLGVSFLVEDANANEVLKAYEIATQLGVTDFYLRAKTGLHGIDVIEMSTYAREAVLEAIGLIQHNKAVCPKLHVSPWYADFLEAGDPPDTAKSYTSCYYCGAARLIVTPPEPGVVWSCTYFRGDPRFHIASLGDVPFDSSEFENRRIAAIRRIFPPRDCAGVICDRDFLNRTIWELKKSERNESRLQFLDRRFTA